MTNQRLEIHGKVGGLLEVETGDPHGVVSLIMGGEPYVPLSAEQVRELIAFLQSVVEPEGERSLRRAEKPCGIVFHISPADNRCLNCGWAVLDHAHGPSWHMSKEHQAACAGCNRKEK